MIEIPEFLRDELKEYLDRLYGIPLDERIFPIGQEAVQHKMKRNSEKAGVKKIRVHDLRHSHVAYLINRGVEPLIIKERLGHNDIRITLNTYGHLYPSKQRTIADMLDADVKKANIRTEYTDNADRTKKQREDDLLFAYMFRLKDGSEDSSFL
ncbi:Phage integrase family protein [Butyrivibrio sp. INlla14]|nr:Phage integrase family protein [Butyrivibrio sp. INlla14]